MTTPSPWVSALKVARPTKPQVKEHAAEIRRLANAGLSHPAIARRLGPCVSSIRKTLRASRPT
jgi:hypothetical protein